MQPWIDRAKLTTQAKGFVKKYGYFLRTHAKRISSLVEIAVYNSVVSYYDELGYKIVAKGLGPKKSFIYRISPTGLIENFSCFEAKEPKSGKTYTILQNIKIQSAHHKHLYYTPDVVVCLDKSAITENQASGRQHSYIENPGLITFVEVKHLVPFPEALFSFTGLVQEFTPSFIKGTVKTNRKRQHLTPMIVFTGPPSKHSEAIRDDLQDRYGVNIVYNTQKADGKIASFRRLNKYSKSRRTVSRK